MMSFAHVVMTSHPALKTCTSVMCTGNSYVVFSTTLEHVVWNEYNIIVIKENSFKGFIRKSKIDEQTVLSHLDKLITNFIMFVPPLFTLCTFRSFNQDQSRKTIVAVLCKKCTNEINTNGSNS